MTTCYGYTRVSTVKQGEGVSLEAQKQAISDYADRKGITISEWVCEKETAAKSGRPLFDKMIRDLRKGRADGFVVHKIDRSARNFRDWARIAELADQGLDVHFATEPLDFHSRGGRLTADIQAVIAADYIRNLRDETIKGLQGRLKQGLYPYKAPLGYLDQGRGKPKIPDPERAPLIRDMFELYGTGKYSLRSLEVEMAARGLKSHSGGLVTRSSIEKLLANPFYTGLIRIRRTGETYDGVHEPLITAALFGRVQDVKEGRYGKKQTRHMYTYRGLLKCRACEASLTGERQKGRVYYRCHTPGCPSRTLREDAIEAAVVDFFRQFEIDDDHFEKLAKRLQAWFESKRRHQDKTAAVSLQIARVLSRLENLTSVLIDGVIDGETYRQRKEALHLEKRQLEEKRRMITECDTKLDTLLKFFELVKTLAPLYQNANPSEKRLLVELTTSNRLVTPENLAFRPSDWLQRAHDATAVPDGCLSRATLRTGREVQEPRLQVLWDILPEPSLRDLTAQLQGIRSGRAGQVQ